MYMFDWNSINVSIFNQYQMNVLQVSENFKDRIVFMKKGLIYQYVV